LRLDRRVKIPLYARAGITEAWLLDLTTEHVEGTLRRSASPTSPSPSTTCSADTGGRT
jgi:Uma2 family endonuclease